MRKKRESQFENKRGCFQSFNYNVVLIHFSDGQMKTKNPLLTEDSSPGRIGVNCAN